MKQLKCGRCGRKIIEGQYCSDCKEIRFEEQMDKKINRKLSKLRDTIEYGITRVKSAADGQFWCTAHGNCFRATISVDEKGNWQGESEAHVDKQYERWKHHRKLGRTVYCNLVLKPGMGRPDLIVVDKGFIFIEEIVKSEKEGSIIEKKNKYPFPVSVVKV